MTPRTELDSGQRDELFAVLKERFVENMQRHVDITWEQVQTKLEADKGKLWSVNEMEQTGGEPDVVCLESDAAKLTVADCSPESPDGRRNLCFDEAALASRKKNKPQGSALGVAAAMGIELLTEEQYRALQELGEFDLKTSSWIATPEAVRKHGGALFCDRRYHHVFTYHNGAESYYGARGFRGCVAL